MHRSDTGPNQLFVSASREPVNEAANNIAHTHRLTGVEWSPGGVSPTSAENSWLVTSLHHPHTDTDNVQSVRDEDARRRMRRRPAAGGRRQRLKPWQLAGGGRGQSCDVGNWYSEPSSRKTRLTVAEAAAAAAVAVARPTAARRENNNNSCCTETAQKQFV